MSEQTNKALIGRYLKALSGRPKDDETLRRFIDDSGLREHIALFEAAFPSYELSTDDLIAEGDKVVLRGTFQGTHRGELLGIAPTGRSVSVPLIIIYQIRDERIVEHWLAVDRMELMQQLGVGPAAAHTV